MNLSKTLTFLKFNVFSFLALSALSAEAGKYKTIAELVPSSFARKVANGSDIVGIQWFKAAGKQADGSAQAFASGANNLVQGVYVSGTTAVNLALRIGFGSDAIADLQQNRVGLWITGPEASQNLFRGLTATSAHLGMTVFKSAEFATRAATSLTALAASGATQIFKASMYTADAVVQLGREYVLKPTCELFQELYKLTTHLLNVPYGVVKGAASVPVGILGGIFSGVGITPPGNTLEQTASKLRKSAKKSFKRTFQN